MSSTRPARQENPRVCLSNTSNCVTTIRAVSRQYFPPAAADGVLQFASISFDVALEEIGPTLICGATLILAPFEQVPDLDGFAHFVESKNLQW